MNSATHTYTYAKTLSNEKYRKYKELLCLIPRRLRPSGTAVREKTNSVHGAQGGQGTSGTPVRAQRRVEHTSLSTSKSNKSEALLRLVWEFCGVVFNLFVWLCQRRRFDLVFIWLFDRFDKKAKREIVLCFD
jgi:hypothetical protein